MKGIKVSKSGQNVLTAKSRDLSVNSASSLYKVFKQDKGVVKFLSTETSTTKRTRINHNLGYEPLFTVYAERAANSGIVRIADSSGQGLATDTAFARAGVTTTDLIIDFESFAFGVEGDYHFYYYIFYDSGQKG